VLAPSPFHPTMGMIIRVFLSFFTPPPIFISSYHLISAIVCVFFLFPTCHRAGGLLFSGAPLVGSADILFLAPDVLSLLFFSSTLVWFFPTKTPPCSPSARWFDRQRDRKPRLFVGVARAFPFFLCILAWRPSPPFREFFFQNVRT